MEEQRQKSKELCLWSETWRRPSSESASLGLGDALQLHKKDLAGTLWVFRAPEACTVRRMCCRAAHDHHGYPARV